MNFSDAILIVILVIAGIIGLIFAIVWDIIVWSIVLALILIPIGLIWLLIASLSGLM